MRDFEQSKAEAQISFEDIKQKIEAFPEDMQEIGEYLQVRAHITLSEVINDVRRLAEYRKDPKAFIDAERASLKRSWDFIPDEHHEITLGVIDEDRLVRDLAAETESANSIVACVSYIGKGDFAKAAAYFENILKTERQIAEMGLPTASEIFDAVVREDTATNDKKQESMSVQMRRFISILRAKK